MPWLAVSAFLLGVTRVGPDWILLVKQKTHLMMLTYPLALALNVGLNYLLIPLIGSIGAAYASAASAGLALLLSWLVARRFMMTPWPVATAGRAALATAAMSAVLLIGPHDPLGLVAGTVTVAAGVYVAVLLITGESLAVEAATQTKKAVLSVASRLKGT